MDRFILMRGCCIQRLVMTEHLFSHESIRAFKLYSNMTAITISANLVGLVWQFHAYSNSTVHSTTDPY